eukprot:8267558-Pyramimonas_sp.AAC.1
MLLDPQTKHVSPQRSGHLLTPAHGVPVAVQNLKTTTRQQALEYFDNTWSITENLFSALVGT